MNGILFAVLACIILMPFLFKRVEENLEIFLFTMGVIATGATGTLTWQLAREIAAYRMLYMITAAVFLAGLIFKFGLYYLRKAIRRTVIWVPLPIFCAIIVMFLGIISSFITAIIAALILVEIVECLPVAKEDKINLCVLACFAIGMGAALTPLGEPLATIVVGILDEDFHYLISLLGRYIFPGIFALSCMAGVAMVGADRPLSENPEERRNLTKSIHTKKAEHEETYADIVFRAAKIFLFVVALELLGTGFKPLIDTYVIHLDGMLLYWINIISAVLDNATIAAAEVSPLMSQLQLKGVLMGLLISGGILIPGNIPNIICAGKLRIGSKEWARKGLPIGIFMLSVYSVVLFIL
ncbi:DUF1646 family protein [Bacilliculturomica massiliensis]|uniref:DUF1646 family protein n=1 Tax=Bacilliculturomica massiliensis TaxID=1917867 RepID=UPI00102F7F4E|nr:DUF1646 family protein [Bacilliculturomica massiliensis]